MGVKGKECALDGSIINGEAMKHLLVARPNLEALNLLPDGCVVDDPLAAPAELGIEDGVEIRVGPINGQRLDSAGGALVRNNSIKDLYGTHLLDIGVIEGSQVRSLEEVRVGLVSFDPMREDGHLHFPGASAVNREVISEVQIIGDDHLLVHVDANLGDLELGRIGNLEVYCLRSGNELAVNCVASGPDVQDSILLEELKRCQ